jgi:hypothetical protein
MKRPRVVNNKARGKKLEAELVAMAIKIGIPAVRSWGSDGRSLGLAEEVDVVLDKRITVQCKRKKRLPKFLKTTSMISVIREDDGKSFTVLPTDMFFWLYKLAKLVTIESNSTIHTTLPELIK